MNNELLEFEVVEPTYSGLTCRTCYHRQRWQCYGDTKVFQYCGIRKSNRTMNGLLKIKCKNKACELYKKQ